MIRMTCGGLLRETDGGASARAFHNGFAAGLPRAGVSPFFQVCASQCLLTAPLVSQISAAGAGFGGANAFIVQITLPAVRPGDVICTLRGARAWRPAPVACRRGARGPVSGDNLFWKRPTEHIPGFPRPASHLLSTSRASPGPLST